VRSKEGGPRSYVQLQGMSIAEMRRADKRARNAGYNVVKLQEKK